MYSVGQVLFVVLAKKGQVYPMQIVEVITKKTLKGEEVQYVLQAGSDKNTTVLFDQIDGEVFDSSEKVRAVLTKRATAQVTRMVDTAASKAKQWYGSAAPTATSSSPQTIDDLPDFNADPEEKEQELEAQPPSPPEETGPMSVMMPDGTIAKIKLPAV